MVIEDPFIPQWYVLYTKSRFESVVDLGLKGKNIESFLPKIKTRSRRRDRKVVLNTPLFPGYLFVKTDLYPEKHLEILKTPGVVRFIGSQNGPMPVSPDTIESLIIIVTAESDIFSGRGMMKGARVMVTRGPFTGVIGTFVHYKGRHRIVVNIETLGRYASVEIETEDVAALPEIFS
jgi:transcriptional antiterminator NusG